MTIVMQYIRAWVRFVIRMGMFAVALLWPAGTCDWWEAWVVIGIWFMFGVVMISYLVSHDPDLLAERMRLLPFHKDQKPWDRVIMLLFLIAGFSLYMVPGFDVVRYGWSEPLPLWLRVTAMLVHIPCFVALGWIMHENSYLSQVVKIDNERGHKVITTGPYSFVRHPMYTVIIVLLTAVPVALGSRYALLVAGFLMVLLVVRTWYEDRTLHAELEGYPEYARKTRYKLVPGVW
jgi:protein-S-isoprenylcysteine O-methyltransferase Ste14